MLFLYFLICCMDTVILEKGEKGLGPTGVCTGLGPTGIYTGMGPTGPIPV